MKTLVECVQLYTVGRPKFQQYYLLTTVFYRHLVSPGFYCNTYKHILHHKKNNNRLYFMLKKE